MNIDSDEKYTFLAMLDKLIIVKLIKQFNPDVKFSQYTKFYGAIHMEHMHYDDLLENLQFFFKYSDIGTFKVGYDEHAELLGDEVGEDVEGAIFSIQLKELKRLIALGAPTDKILELESKVYECFNRFVEIDWLHFKTEEYNHFVGIIFHYDFSWHRIVEQLIPIILDIRKECENYENRSNNC